MLTPLAILALIFVFPAAHDGNLKGGEAYQQLHTFELQYVKDAKASNKPIDRQAELAAFKQKAEELLSGIDVATVPAREGLDWSRVLDTATRYQDSLKVLDRFIADNPVEDSIVQAKLAEVVDYVRTNQTDKATDLLTELKPTSETQAPFVAGADAAQARLIARTGGEAAGLKFLDTVEPNFKGFGPKATANLSRERSSLMMPATRAKLIGESAPAIPILADKYGNFTDLASLKGKVVLLDFFAHWCGPCIASMPDTRVMSDALGDKLAVIGVTAYYGYYGAKRNIDPKEEFADMKSFMDEHKIDHPVVYVDHSEFADYGCNGIPEFVLIGKDGRVKKIQIGYSKGSFVEFRKAVEAEVAK